MNILTKFRFPTIVGLFTITISLSIGVFLVQNAKTLIFGAESSALPENVRISNVTHSSFTVTWTSERKVSGIIKWGRSPSFLDNLQSEEDSLFGFTHSITITNLEPLTTYHFKIVVGLTEHDNSGMPWQITTGESLPLPKKPFVVSGSVLSPKGTPVNGALVYTTISGSDLLSTMTGKNGSFFVPISFARSKDLKDYIDINGNSSLIEISVHAGFNDIAFAQIYPRSANPIPPILMNQVHDFRNTQAGRVGEIPNAEIILPQEATPSSGFGEALGTFIDATSGAELDKMINF